MWPALTSSLSVLTETHYDEYLAVKAVAALDTDKVHAPLAKLLRDLTTGTLTEALATIGNNVAYWNQIGMSTFALWCRCWGPGL